MFITRIICVVYINVGSSKKFFGGKQLPIEEVSQVKYLGVFFDEKFSWKKLI